MRKHTKSEELLMPQLVDSRPGVWQVIESVLDDAAVDKGNRIAYVPRALTDAQKRARLHELYHVKISPVNWSAVRNHILNIGDERGQAFNSTAVSHLAKMLEENRVDYLLWSELGVDLRPAREALDWGAMTLPDGEDDLLEATGSVLQLAWTVWASTGFPGGRVPDPPPKREGDEETRRYFDACWRIIQQHDRDLARAVVRSCLLMYNDPFPDVRDEAAAEIARWFLDKEPEKPPEKPEEKEEQEAALAEAQELEDEREHDKTGGVDNDVEVRQHVEIHDHTRGLRRGSLIIRQHYTPQPTGTLLKYPFRYYLDKAVFGRRIKPTGALMIDMSGSMTWTNDDLMFLLSKMPTMWIAGYAGVNSGSGILGRICILAKNGRFNEFTGTDPQHNGGNDVDYEALKLLSLQPGPRFWLSDGLVCGGKLTDTTHSPPTEVKAECQRTSGTAIIPYWISMYWRLIWGCNEVMRRNQIIRVDDKDTLMKLVRGQSVTVFRSSFPSEGHNRAAYFGQACPPEPMRFQL